MKTTSMIKRLGICLLAGLLLTAACSCAQQPAPNPPPNSSDTGTVLSGTSSSETSDSGASASTDEGSGGTETTGDGSEASGSKTASTKCPDTTKTHTTTKNLSTKTAGTASGTGTTGKPTNGRSLAVALVQYHPGIPGFDAEYQLRAEYDGVLVNASSIAYSCTNKNVRISANKVVIPESVRNAGRAVVIDAKHTSGATAQLSIPVRSWTPSFTDEFEGSTLDSSKWAPFEVLVDYGGEEVTVPDCYTIQNGVLSMKVDKRTTVANGKTYTLAGAALSTYDSFSQKTGCFLASIKMPEEAGLCSAFWLMPKPYVGWGRCYHYYTASNPGIGCGEIDIVEYSNAWKGKYQTTEHFWDFSTGQHHSEMVEVPVQNITSAFHVYGAVIEEDASYFYCDGKLVKVNDDVAQKGKGNKRSLDSFMLLSFHTGEREGGWLGGWNFEDSAFPIYTDVDRVRAYR